jgi:hypothetical protein
MRRCYLCEERRWDYALPRANDARRVVLVLDDDDENKQLTADARIVPHTTSPTGAESTPYSSPSTVRATQHGSPSTPAELASIHISPCDLPLLQ